MKDGIKFLLACFVLIICIALLVRNDNPSSKNIYSTTAVDSFTVDAGIFPVDVKFFLGASPLPALLYTVENVDSSASINSFEGAAGVTFYKPGYPIVVWLPSSPKTEEEKSVLVHELLHVTRGIMLNCGVPMSDSSEEVYSYEMQYLYKKFFEKVK